MKLIPLLRWFLLTSAVLLTLTTLQSCSSSPGEPLLEYVERLTSYKNFDDFHLRTFILSGSYFQIRFLDSTFVAMELCGVPEDHPASTWRVEMPIGKKQSLDTALVYQILRFRHQFDLLAFERIGESSLFYVERTKFDAHTMPSRLTGVVSRGFFPVLQINILHSQATVEGIEVKPNVWVSATEFLIRTLPSCN